MKVKAASDESEAVKAELDRIGTEYKKLKIRAVDLDEKQVKRNSELEKVIKERDKVKFVICRVEI